MDHGSLVILITFDASLQLDLTRRCLFDYSPNFLTFGYFTGIDFARISQHSFLEILGVLIGLEGRPGIVPFVPRFAG